MRALLLLALFLPAQAKVYWRQAGDVPGGWNRAYHAEVMVNGHRGEASLFAAPGSTADTLDSLRQLHQEALVVLPGAQTAWALAVEDGQVYRYLVQPEPSHGGSWVLCLQQSERDAGKPGAMPDAHRLKRVPAFPNSVPTYYLKDADTHMELEISLTRAAPESALDHVGRALAADGWSEALPTGGGLRWFVKRDEMVLVSAQASPDGNTRVLRLHKPIGVK